MPQYRFSPARAAPLILLATLLSHASADYVLVDDYEPSNFFDKFDFFTANDPTQGYVDYVNQTYAQEDGLIGNTSDRVYIGVDTKHTYNVYSDRGRPSVRLQSTQSYTHGLFILDLNHMPYGCGTWPAWWTVGDINTWPADGEIDIIEGVNANQNNTNKIYTAKKGCSITGRGQSAIADAFDCSQGCGSQSTNPYSYGAGFGMISGGVYAMEWTSDYIRVWFFDRSNIPRSISAGQPDSSDFGMPMSNFQGGCDIDRYFRNHKIVFDITFCGTWAGQTFNASSTCPMTPGYDAWNSCKFYVAGNPSAFQNAYWDINWMKVYQNVGGSSSAAASSSYPSTAVSVAGSSFFGSSSGDLALGHSSPTSSAIVFPSSFAATPSSFTVVPSSLPAVKTPGQVASIPSTPTLVASGSSSSVQFSVAPNQPCSPISAYLGSNRGFRTGIGDIAGGLTMCETTCGRRGNCTDVFYVHYTGDFSSPLGYWDCWYGPISVGSFVCAQPTAKMMKRKMELGKEEEQQMSQKFETGLALSKSRIQRRQYGRLDSPNLGSRQEDYQVYVLASGGNMTSNSTLPTPFFRPSNSSVPSSGFSTPALEPSGFLSFPSISSTTEQIFSILPISVSSEQSFPISTPLASETDQIFSILPFSISSEDSFPTSAPPASETDQIFSILPIPVSSGDSFPTSTPIASETDQIFSILPIFVSSEDFIPTSASETDQIFSILPISVSSEDSFQASSPSTSEPAPAETTSDRVFSILPFSIPTSTPLSSGTAPTGTPNGILPATFTPFPSVLSPLPSSEASSSLLSSELVEASYATPSSETIYTLPLLVPSSDLLSSVAILSTPTEAISTPSQPDIQSTPVYDSSGTSVSTISSSIVVPYLAPPTDSNLFTPLIIATPSVDTPSPPSSTMNTSTSVTPLSDLPNPFGVLPPVSQASAILASASISPSANSTTFVPPLFTVGHPFGILPPLSEASAILASRASESALFAVVSSSDASQATYVPPNIPASPPPSSEAATAPSSPLSSLIASLSASLSAEISASFASSAAASAAPTDGSYSWPSSVTQAEPPTRTGPGIVPVFVTGTPVPDLSSVSVPGGCPVPAPTVVTVTVYGGLPPDAASATPFSSVSLFRID